MKKGAISFVIFCAMVLVAVVWFGVKKIEDLHTQVGQLTEKNLQLNRTLSHQSNLIAEQSLSFHRANQISGTAYRHGVIQRMAAEEREIEYKTILKKEPTCELPIPITISERLLNNTHRLRAIAISMSPYPENIDASHSTFTTERTLTYCDLVFWVDALLTDIGQANAQLIGIEQFEEVRQREKTH